MRAARIVGPRAFTVENVPIVTPSPGQVRFRVEGCGVCASNLGPWQGLPWLTYPLEPGEGGHEAWGMVDAVGAGVKHLREGQRIAALSDRGYAEYDLADAEHVIQLAGGAGPMPAEPLGCAVNVFRRSRIVSGSRVAIIGLGFIGAVVTRLAASTGAEVTALSRRDFALDIGRQMGARHLIRLDDHAPVLQRARELTHGELYDIVVEAVGLQWPLDLAGELTRERGTLVIAGYHQDGPRQVNMQLWNWRGIDVINAHERDPHAYLTGMRLGIDATARGELVLERLLTHRFPLESLGEALDSTAERPDGFLKAYIAP